MRSLLNLENPDLVVARGDRRLLVSLNPDLRTDFGHFLNYERQIANAWAKLGGDYVCFANSASEVVSDRIVRVFPEDSGYYALVRGDARGREREIAESFVGVVRAALGSLKSLDRYERIDLFLYCGSSLLARELCELSWDSRIRFVINAFWDFLLPSDCMDYAHIPRVVLQNRVRLLAMSELHRDQVHRATGLVLNWIPNPPPLLSDVDAIESAKGSLRSRGSEARLRVFLPGLMTMGKGRDFTEQLCRYVVQLNGGGLDWVVRDRTGVLEGISHTFIEVMRGDLSLDDVFGLYREADFAILPYDAETFSVRTSGALVDCLVFGVVPVVAAGTWLAYICEKYKFGVVLDSLEPKRAYEALLERKKCLRDERMRVVSASVSYLADNSWSSLIARISDWGGDCGRGLLYATEVASGIFQEANRLFRDERYEDAARLYTWLVEGEPRFQPYAKNLELCARRLGVSRAELAERLV